MLSSVALFCFVEVLGCKVLVTCALVISRRSFELGIWSQFPGSPIAIANGKSHENDTDRYTSMNNQSRVLISSQHMAGADCLLRKKPITQKNC